MLPYMLAKLKGPKIIKPYRLLQPIDLPDRKWTAIKKDFITALSMTRKRNVGNLNVVHRLSKMIRSIPILRPFYYVKLLQAPHRWRSILSIAAAADPSFRLFRALAFSVCAGGSNTSPAKNKDNFWQNQKMKFQ